MAGDGWGLVTGVVGGGYEALRTLFGLEQLFSRLLLPWSTLNTLDSHRAAGVEPGVLVLEGSGIDCSLEVLAIISSGDQL